MGLKSLESPAIIGNFFERYEEHQQKGFSEKIGMKFESDQSQETYKFLGASPGMREWIGGRQPKGLRENGITIENKLFESTLEVTVQEKRRDKTGQVEIRIGELAEQAAAHQDELVTTLIENGESTACYDGQFFFDTDHLEGDSGTQTNDLTASDYSELNVGTANNPTPNEMADVIFKGIQHMYSFKNDQGKPMNSAAKKFLVMVPINLWSAAQQAIFSKNLETGSGVRNNPLMIFDIELVSNPFLTWTTKLAIFRTDGSAKPIILQEEVPVNIQVLGDGSDYQFMNKADLYGVEREGNVGYGYWQHSVLLTLS